MVVLFVGDTPSASTDPNNAFVGAKCETRLKAWIATLLGPNDEFNIINSTDEFYAECVESYVKQGCPVIALGNKAALRLKGYPHFKLPHPSGLNRQINNKKFIENQLQKAKIYIKLSFIYG